MAAIGEFILETNPEPLWKSILLNGSGIPNLSIELTIQRDSDSYYWDGTSWVITLPISLPTMVEKSASNNPGYYTYPIDTVGFLGTWTRTGFTIRYRAVNTIDFTQQYFSVENMPGNENEENYSRRIIRLNKRILKKVQ